MRVVLLITALSVFFAAPALARDKLLDIQEVTSPGGITAWLVEDHSIPVIAMNFGFKGAGALLDPPDKQGLARLLSNTMDEGAGDIPSQAFQKELRDQSISLRFGSSRDHFTGSLKTLTRNKDRAFELMALALSRPRFDEEPVNRMIAANQSRIRSALSDPGWIAARILNDVAFAGHPYARNSGGTLSSLGTITPDDLRRFKQSYLGKNNLVVAVAGDITKAELTGVLDRVFGALPVVKLPDPPPDISVQNSGKITVHEKNIPQTIIEALQPGIDRSAPGYHTAQVMNFVLGSSGFGSRLTREIREKRGLTYGIHSYFMDMDHFDGLGVSTSTENKNARTILDLVEAEWKKMKGGPVSEKELADAQAYLIGSLPLALTSTDKISGLMLSLQMDGLPQNYLDQREQAIRTTSTADIQRLAKELLDVQKMTVVLVGKPEGVKADQQIETLPNVE